MLSQIPTDAQPEQLQAEDLRPAPKRRRNRATAKAAGSSMETCASNYLAEALGSDFIERRRLQGSKDRGDIAGVRTLQGGRVVVEVKDHNGAVQVKPWLDEAETERGNDDALIGVVVFKRSRISYTNAGEQGVLMTLETFARLLSGGVDL